METINLKLDVFEGPLDLLLHLIKQLKIDIYDIPIAEITKQYMSYIHTMQTLELDVAGEYIVMASTLMAIKSQMLLPTETYEGDYDEELDEGVDPREGLVQQLLEYRKFKFAATILQEKEEERSQYFTKEPMNVEEFKEESQELSPTQYNTIDLFLAFHQMLEKKKKKQPMQTTIEAEDISIDERMGQIVYHLREVILESGSNQGVPFDSFFEENHSKSEIVTTFMALLELMKKKQIYIKQETNYDPIYLFGTQEILREEEAFDE